MAVDATSQPGQPNTITLGVLAGEPSGDNLAAGMMRQIQLQAGDAVTVRFVGVGGPQMIAAGLQVLAPMESLAVNGFREPLLRLPSLVTLLRRLIKTFQQIEIDAFVGVDFNVFNFLLEKALKKRGIATAHYVSPSVYAWRTGRTRRVAKSADLLLCLYPFEPAFYRDTSVNAQFVGHPLADEITPDTGSATAAQEARRQLNISPENKVLAVLPGSRMSEVALMIDEFLGAAALFSRQHEPTMIVIPCLRETLRARIEQAIQDAGLNNVVVYEGNARQALIAADLVLVKSGTSTLEAMLVGRAMVVSYKLGGLTYQIARRVVRTPYVALPNILADQPLVPELLQDAASASALAAELAVQAREAAADSPLRRQFAALHDELRQGADAKAAAAVLGLLSSRFDRKR